MSMQDPVADMLTRIRNAQAMGIESIVMPYSKFKEKILNVLKEEGFINDLEVLSNENKKDIKVSLKYYQDRPVIEQIHRVSKPALRVYRSYSDLPSIRGGLGIAVISTSKGVMTDKSARQLRLGGEVLCTVE